VPERRGDYEFSDADRYTALGVPRHPVKLVCKGPCEGTGVFPVYMAEGDHRTYELAALVADEDDPDVIALWRAAEAESPADDGWHFVTCSGCNGTGLDGAPDSASYPERTP
jgi:hypothetical protein